MMVNFATLYFRLALLGSFDLTMMVNTEFAGTVLYLNPIKRRRLVVEPVTPFILVFGASRKAMSVTAIVVLVVEVIST